MNKGALGIIETYGYVGAIEACDAAVKASMVEVLGLERVRGGRINITITGDVAAVKAALDAAQVAGARLTELITTHVIPRPDDSLWSILPKGVVVDEENSNPAPLKREDPEDEEGESKADDQEDQISSEEDPVESSMSSDDASVKQKFTREELSKMRVVELRRLARHYPTSLERGEIKFVNKAELVDALDNYFKEAGDING